MAGLLRGVVDMVGRSIDLGAPHAQSRKPRDDKSPTLTRPGCHARARKQITQFLMKCGQTVSSQAFRKLTDVNRPQLELDRGSYFMR
jgi:hypothetical protein